MERKKNRFEVKSKKKEKNRFIMPFLFPSAFLTPSNPIHGEQKKTKGEKNDEETNSQKNAVFKNVLIPKKRQIQHERRTNTAFLHEKFCLCLESLS
jgi:hypothetical protein